MKAAIMQPYFLPYIGYFQLIEAVDLFLVYDNIEYTRKGWINRNRFLQNGGDAVFSVPLSKDSDFLPVRDRTVSASFNRRKLLNRFKAAYETAPYFEPAYGLFAKAILNSEDNLFTFIYQSILEVCAYLEITSEIRISSDVKIDHSLRNQDKVIALCQAVGADTYINAVGGRNLYAKDAFQAHGITLKFLQPKPLVYRQFDNPFVPWLSIIDVMMFNSRESLKRSVSQGFDLI